MDGTTGFARASWSSATPTCPGCRGRTRLSLTLSGWSPRLRMPARLPILDGADVVYILRVPGPQIMNVAINIGARLPAHATALGKGATSRDCPSRNWRRTSPPLSFRAWHRRTIVSADALRAELADVRANGWAISDKSRRGPPCH